MSLMRKSNDFLPSSFFDDFFKKDILSNVMAEGTLPKVNIVEDDDSFSVEMAAPGMKKEDFHLELDNNTLTISSERTDENVEEKNGKNFTKREFSYQAFQRSFYLPNTVDSEKIKAQYKDGILSLVIPKKEEAKKKPAKTIAIS